MKKERSQRNFNESRLLQRLAGGDVAAFTQIHDLYADSVYRISRQLLRSDELAQDVVQEIFFSLWQKRINFTHVENVRTYLVVSGKNLALKYLRKIALQGRVGKEYLNNHPQVANVTDNDFNTRELKGLLHEAIEMLPARQKQVYELSEIEGLRHDTIAERLNISVNTVKAHLLQAHNTIRKRLQPYSTSLTILSLLFLRDSV